MELGFESYSKISDERALPAGVIIGSALAHPEGEFALFMNGREKQFVGLEGQDLASKAREFYTEHLAPVGFDATMGFDKASGNIVGFNAFAYHDKSGTMARHVFRVQSFKERQGIGTSLLCYELDRAFGRSESVLFCGKQGVEERHPGLGRIFEKLSADKSVPATYIGDGRFAIHERVLYSHPNNF